MKKVFFALLFRDWIFFRQIFVAMWLGTYRINLWRPSLKFGNAFRHIYLYWVGSLIGTNRQFFTQNSLCFTSIDGRRRWCLRWYIICQEAVSIQEKLTYCEAPNRVVRCFFPRGSNLSYISEAWRSYGT